MEHFESISQEELDALLQIDKSALIAFLPNIEGVLTTEQLVIVNNYLQK